MFRTLLLIPLLATACADKSIGLGGGSAPDARMYADVYTWECDEDGSGADLYEGVFSYLVSLEYAPDALVDRDLPSSGCTKGIDLFPSDAGAGAHDLDGSPEYENESIAGGLTHQGTGFYHDDVLGNQHACTPAEDLLGSGTSLLNADMFTSASTPAPDTFEDVTFSTEIDEVSGVAFDSVVDVEWVAGDWTDSFIQVRRESGGALVESVTCNTTGGSTYTIGPEVWDLFSGAVEVDVTNLYVGVQNSKSSDAEDGQKITTVTRALHVAVVQD